jgi:hypothetical protein
MGTTSILSSHNRWIMSTSGCTDSILLCIRCRKSRFEIALICYGISRVQTKWKSWQIPSLCEGEGIPIRHCRIKTRVTLLTGNLQFGGFVSPNGATAGVSRILLTRPAQKADGGLVPERLYTSRAINKKLLKRGRSLKTHGIDRRSKFAV